MGRASGTPGPVYRITGARRGLSEDVRGRQTRYLVSMGIRTACFVLAVVVPVPALRVLFLVGALVLPYLAVVAANAGRERVVTLPPTPPPGAAPPRGLGPGRGGAGPVAGPGDDGPAGG